MAWWCGGGGWLLLHRTAVASQLLVPFVQVASTPGKRHLCMMEARVLALALTPWAKCLVASLTCCWPCCTHCASASDPSTFMSLARVVTSPQRFKSDLLFNAALLTSSTVLRCRRRCPDCQRLPRRLYSRCEGIHAGICECDGHLGRLLRNTGVSGRLLLSMLLHTNTPFSQVCTPAASCTGSSTAARSQGKS